MTTATLTGERGAPRPAKAKPIRRGFLSQLGLTWLLGLRDLKDEALLTICLVSAIAAVLAPIMVLAGLKFGFIDFLREQMIRDPSFRLIRPPTGSRLLPPAFFADLKANKDIAFVQPTVWRRTPARAAGPSQKRGSPIDLVATGPGDPLITENKGVIPGDNEVTLSLLSAERMKAKVGDTVSVTISRSVRGKRERVKIPLKVVSILNARADGKITAYVPLALIQDVARFRIGVPVVERGWKGQTKPPTQTFDAVYLLLAEKLNEVELHSLRISNGFAEAKLTAPEDFTKATGMDPGKAGQIVRLTNRNKAVRGSSINRFRNRLAGRKFTMLAVADNMKLQIAGGEGGKASDAIALRGLDPKQFTLKLVEGDISGWQGWKNGASFGLMDRVVLPKAVAQERSLKVGSRVTLSLIPASGRAATQDLTLTLTVDGIVDGPYIYMPAALVGALHASRVKRLTYDKTLNTLVEYDPGLRDFRLYGKSIDVVPTLARALQDKGIEVTAKVDTIERVQKLDAALTQMTIIIGLVALIGGAAVLIASFYAAIERKKGELSLLRLLGFSRFSIFAMPIQQSLMLALAGFAIAVLLFVAFSGVINVHYAADLTAKGNVCRLEPRHYGFFFLITLFIATFASLFAAGRTTRIDPAEALRNE